MTEFKPLNVQFEVKDKNIADVLRNLAMQLGDARGDRRTGAGAAAEIIVLRVLKDYPELLREFFEDESSIGIGEQRTGDVTSPKERSPRQAKK